MPNKRGQGRKPKPTHLKLLEGEPNKKRINFDEPKPNAKAPKCPSWLNKEAKRKWKELSPELERLGLLTKIDGDLFAAYCSAYWKMEWAEKEIKKARKLEIQQLKNDGKKEKDEPTTAGMIQCDSSKRGFTTTAYVWTFNKSLEQVRSLASEFGLSPSSRTRIKIEDPDIEDDLLTK